MTARRFHHCENKKCSRRLASLVGEDRASVYCAACEEIGRVCREQGLTDGRLEGLRRGLRVGRSQGAWTVAAVATVVGGLFAVWLLFTP